MDPGLLIIILFLLAPLLERLLKLGRPPQEPPEGQLPRGPRRPGQRLPGQRVPGEAPQVPEQEERPFRSIPSADAEPEQAASMLPDDLWEILTGERRTPTPPAPRVPAEAAPAERTSEATAAHAPTSRSPGPAGEAARAADRQRREAESRERDRLRSRERSPGPARTRERPAAPARERRLPPVTMRSPREAQPAARRTPAAPPASSADAYVREIPVRESPVVVSYETEPLDGVERRARFEERRARLSAPATVQKRARSDEYTFHGPDDVRRAFVMSEILGKPKGLED